MCQCVVCVRSRTILSTYSAIPTHTPCPSQPSRIHAATSEASDSRDRREDLLPISPSPPTNTKPIPLQFLSDNRTYMLSCAYGFISFIIYCALALGNSLFFQVSPSTSFWLYIAAFVQLLYHQMGCAVASSRNVVFTQLHSLEIESW